MEQQDATSTSSIDNNDGSQKYQQLCQAIEQYWEDLLRGIEIQIKKLGLAQDLVSIKSLAEDVLHDAIVKALDKVEQYDHNRPARPWLWTIALNELRMLGRRRRKVEDKYVTLAGDDKKVRRISEKPGNVLSEDEMFDILYLTEPNSPIDTGLTLDDLLSLVKASDREILELVFIQGFRGKTLAEKIGCTEGAAYVKQSRAIARLREAYLQSEQIIEEDE